MLNFTAIRDVIIFGLHAYTGKPVIMLEQAYGKPAYSFIGYKFTVPYNLEAGQPTETWTSVPSADPNFREDIEYTRTEQPKMTLSITVYSDNIDEAHELALQAQAWFSFYGRDYLSGNNVVVVETTAVQNRDTLIVGDYERRQGFDVILRATSELKLTVETIEKAEILRKE